MSGWIKVGVGLGGNWVTSGMIALTTPMSTWLGVGLELGIGLEVTMD